MSKFLPSLNPWSWLPARKTEGIDIPSVAIHDVESSPDERAKTLKHLLRANHANHAILFNHQLFHNHMPHILGSAYIIGAEPDHLRHVYDVEARTLEPWRDPPGEVSRHDWQKYLGDRRYERAFVDFFTDELVRFGYDWEKLVEEYFFQGDQPLISGALDGLGHPLIHLGYAYELSNRPVAIEALAMAATVWDGSHKYFDDPSYTWPSKRPTTSLVDILERVHDDKRFDAAVTAPGPANVGALLRGHEGTLLEYWNSWTLTDPLVQFRDSQFAATLLFVGTTGPDTRDYDFFLVHVLTTSHAVRILLPLIPARLHLQLVRQWWLFALVTYVTQMRPAFGERNIKEYDLAGRDWEWVENMALKSTHGVDAHYVKALRAMKEAAGTWGDDDTCYLRAAVRFAATFEQWTGFG